MTAEPRGFFRERDGGIELFVRLTPKSSADRIETVEASGDGRTHLAVRVRAVPENGAANKALEHLLAGAFGVPRSAVEVVSGHTSRHKTVLICGHLPSLAAAVRSLSAKR